MTAPRATIALVLFVAAGSFIAGSWWSRRPADSKAPGGSKILYYRDPMHPAYKSDKPGIAPDCGMQLEPVYADGSSGPAETAGGPPAGNAVRIGAEEQQLIGVRTEEVRRGDAEHHVRILGRVAADERRVYKITAPNDGVIRELGSATTGSMVKAKEPLANFLSRESLDSRNQQAYLVRSDGQAPGAPNTFQLGVLTPELAKDLLRLSGMTEEQIAEVSRTRKVANTIQLSSPVDGLVLSRTVFPEQRIREGDEFFRIADLSSVWVLADVFENEARLLDSASGARITYQGKTFPARRSDVAPQFDPNTRALKVRLEVSNPGSLLRPDMFVDVDFDVKVRSAIAVPVDAVLDSGVRKTVFVDRGGGYFEPRTVETGPRLGDRIVISAGVEPGDRIVVAGNFLIDSESRFQLAAGSHARPVAAHKDPVCGMDVSPAGPEYNFEYRGKTYHFCSEDCKKKFAANPEKYTRAGGPA